MRDRSRRAVHIHDSKVFVLYARTYELVPANYVLSLTHSIHIQMKISRSIYPHLILDIYGSGLDQHAIRSSMPS
jgi:hypothetical protein